jgi:hypothetical protein
MTFEQISALHIWFKIIQCIDNEDNARIYEPCVDQLYKLVYDEDVQSVLSWWMAFWSIITLKYPNVAADHVSQFLLEIIDHKKFNLIGLLPVSPLMS